MPSSVDAYNRVMSGITRTNGACPNTVPRATSSASANSRRAGDRSVGLALKPDRRSVVQRQRHAPPVTRGQITRDKYLERPQPLAAIGFWLRLPAQRLDHVLVVERMPEAIHRCRLVARRSDVLVLGSGVGELPLLDLVDCDAADPHRTMLAQHGDRTFNVLRIGQHGDVDRTERAGAPADADGSGVIDLNVARQRGNVGLHALYRPDEPVD